MGSFVALLRGIGPLNPNMRNEKLREVFVGLGFENVRTVITTGNVLFESPSSAIRGFEKQIEEALPRVLGFSSTTIIRSKKQIKNLLGGDALRSLVQSHEEDVDVTFLKTKPRMRPSLPHQPDDARFTVVALDDLTLGSVVDPTSDRPPDYMRWIEKEFGKEVTTRTYKTVQRIMKRLDGG
jgi:uncharacterized protein (DUF1697 family)